MKRLLLCLLLLSVGFIGCKSKPAAPAGQTAFPTGQAMALPPRQQGMPPPQEGAYVTVRGLVRNPTIPWTEDLTLAQAIVLADYYGFGDPREIIVIRQGVSYPVDPRRLLKGLSNGGLEPGDIVVIR